MYDASNPTKATREDCEAAVGKRATLPLTGEIVEVRESAAGVFVMFEIDARWGFSTRLGFDLEALELDEDG